MEAVIPSSAVTTKGASETNPRAKKKYADGQGGVRKLGNGRYLAQFTLGFDAEGKQVRKSRTTGSLKEAREVLRGLLAEQARMKSIVLSDATVTQVGQLLLAEKVRLTWPRT